MGFEKPKLSVICTTYNDEKEIGLLIDDLKNQTKLPDQFVIVDGGSTDNTIEMLKGFQNNAPFQVDLLYGERRNISQGLNEGIKISTGDYIAIVGTGNHYAQTYLEKLFNRMIDAQADVVFPPIRGKKDIEFCKSYCEAFLNGENGNPIPSNHGGVIKRKVFADFGMFYTKFIYAGEDAEFYERLRSKKCKIICEPEAIIEWDIPRNLTQLRKQFKNYTIASLQMNEIGSLIMQYKRQFRIMAGIVVFILSCCFLHPMFPLAELIVGSIYLLKPKINKSWGAYALREYKMWYQLYLIIKYKQYSKPEYKVNRTMIEYLGEQKL